MKISLSLFFLLFTCSSMQRPSLKRGLTIRKIDPSELQTLGDYLSTMESFCAATTFCFKRLGIFKNYIPIMSKPYDIFYQDQLSRFLNDYPKMAHWTIYRLVQFQPRKAIELYEYLFYPQQLSFYTKDFLEKEIKRTLNETIERRSNELAKFQKNLHTLVQKS